MRTWWRACVVLLTGVLIAAVASAVPLGAAEPVKLSFWYSLGGANGDVIKGLVSDFNASLQGVTVEPSFQGDYYTNQQKLLAAVAAGSPPDVSMIEVGSLAAFASNHALADLGALAKRDGGDLRDFISGLMGNSVYQGTVIGLPFNSSTPIMFLNRGMLRAAGLNPEGPTTWADLRTYAKALTKVENGQTVQWGFELPMDIWYMESMLFEQGKPVMNPAGTQALFNAPAGVTGMQFLLDMMYTDKSMKLPPGKDYNAWDVQMSDFLQGKVAIIFTSTGFLNTILSGAKFDVGTSFLPKAARYGVPVGGTNLVIFAASRRQDAAWTFVRWMTDRVRSIRFAKATGYLPVRTSAAESYEMQQFYKEKPQFAVAVKQLAYAQPAPFTTKLREVQVIVQNYMTAAALKQMSVPDALNRAASEVNGLFK